LQKPQSLFCYGAKDDRSVHYVVSYRTLTEFNNHTVSYGPCLFHSIYGPGPNHEGRELKWKKQGAIHNVQYSLRKQSGKMLIISLRKHTTKSSIPYFRIQTVWQSKCMWWLRDIINSISNTLQFFLIRTWWICHFVGSQSWRKDSQLL